MAPSLTASFTAVPRLASDADFASTSRMLHFGQVALTMSRSRDSSPAQPLSAEGSEVVEPVWPTFVKQPLSVVQSGRP